MNDEKKLTQIAYVIYLLEQIKQVIPEKDVNRTNINRYLKKHQINTNETVSGMQIERLMKSYEERHDADMLSKVKNETLAILAKTYEAQHKDLEAFIAYINSHKSDYSLYINKAKAYLKALDSPKPTEIMDRNSVFLGTWEGQTKEFGGEYKATFVVISIKESVVKGSLKIHYHDEEDAENQNVSIACTGKILNKNDYLSMTYHNENQTTFHFGYVLLKLSSDGKRMNGAFVGHGLTTEKIVHGEFSVKKVNR